MQRRKVSRGELRLNDRVRKTVDEGDSVDTTQKVVNKVTLKSLLRELRGHRMSGKLSSWLYSCPRRKQRRGLNGQLWQKVTVQCLVPGVPCWLMCCYMAWK